MKNMKKPAKEIGIESDKIIERMSGVGQQKIPKIFEDAKKSYVLPTARPVKEILEEISKKSPSFVARNLKEKIIPWINSEAVANREQEKMIKTMAWAGIVGDSVYFDLTILKLNSLRG
jgi:uncharacterized Fe-S cluster protein YjdI